MEFRVGSGCITVNTPDEASLMAEIEARLDRGEGFALATLNLDHLVKLSDSHEFQQAYAAQDLVVADGNPIVWLSQLAGRRVDLVPGSDLVLPLARRAADADVPIALLGSTETTLARTAAELCARVPGLKIAATIAPPFGFDPLGNGGADVLGQVASSGARLCLVALGAPKQELLAARGRELAPHVGFASIGAGLDFIAGSQSRAPVLVRKLALEWLWRLLSNPRRLGMRYLRCAAILPRLVVQAVTLRTGGGKV